MWLWLLPPAPDPTVTLRAALVRGRPHTHQTGEHNRSDRKDRIGEVDHHRLIDEVVERHHVGIQLRERRESVHDPRLDTIFVGGPFEEVELRLEFVGFEDRRTHPRHLPVNTHTDEKTKIRTRRHGTPHLYSLLLWRLLPDGAQ